jgi:hypothetical protein
VFELTQLSGYGPPTRLDAETALRAIESILLNHSPPETRQRWIAEGSFHEHWNLRRVEAGRRFAFDLRLQGSVVSVEGLRFDEAVTVGAFNLGEQAARFTTLGVPEDDLRGVLESLVPLSGNDELIARHQQQLDARLAALHEEHDRRHGL